MCIINLVFPSDNVKNNENALVNEKEKWSNNMRYDVVSVSRNVWYWIWMVLPWQCMFCWFKEMKWKKCLNCNKIDLFPLLDYLVNSRSHFTLQWTFDLNDMKHESCWFIDLELMSMLHLVRTSSTQQVIYESILFSSFMNDGFMATFAFFFFVYIFDGISFIFFVYYTVTTLSLVF